MLNIIKGDATFPEQGWTNNPNKGRSLYKPFPPLPQYMDKNGNNKRKKQNKNAKCAISNLFYNDWRKLSLKPRGRNITWVKKSSQAAIMATNSGRRIPPAEAQATLKAFLQEFGFEAPPVPLLPQYGGPKPISAADLAAAGPSAQPRPDRPATPADISPADIPAATVEQQETLEDGEIVDDEPWD